MKGPMRWGYEEKDVFFSGSPLSSGPTVREEIGQIFDRGIGQARQHVLQMGLFGSTRGTCSSSHKANGQLRLRPLLTQLPADRSGSVAPPEGLSRSRPHRSLEAACDNAKLIFIRKHRRAAG